MYNSATPPLGATHQLKQEIVLQSARIQWLQDQLNLSQTHLHDLTRDRRREEARLLSLPVIYMVTPTYPRWTQKADLTRLCLTLMHVPRLHWIVVEDTDQKTRLVARLLSGENTCKVSNSTQLNIRTPEPMRLANNEPVWRKNRGVEQRNMAIDWLREQAAGGAIEEGGVVYFGDDDNTYDTAVFEEVGLTITHSQHTHTQCVTHTFI